MKRIALIAPSGMLGSMVYNILKDSYKLVLIYRNAQSLKLLEKVYGNVKNHDIIQLDLETLYRDYVHEGSVPSLDSKLFSLDIDRVINCAGIIKPYANISPHMTFFINSALPHLLSSAYKEKLIQITTDCVFSGKEESPYDEKAPFTPTDLYGLSKSLGEPKDRSLVLRTSIIGPEISHYASLISWFLQQKKANGFINHLWNGVTTKQFALICKNLISNPQKFPKTGTYHIFSNEITKYDLLLLLNKRYGSHCEITPTQSEAIDRRLSTIYNLNSLLRIPPIERQIDAL